MNALSRNYSILNCVDNKPIYKISLAIVKLSSLQ